MSNEVQLRVAGDILEGWESITVRRSVDTLAGSFSFNMINVWDLNNVLELYPGLACDVYVSGERIISGYIDSQSPKIDSNSSIINISGRCRTGDLIDCSVSNKPGTWKNIELRSLITSLLNPNGSTFNINLKVDTDLGDKIKEFSINTGESIFEAISRLCKYRAIVPLSTNKGELLLTNIGRNKSHDDLFYGVNVENAEGNATYIDRFSEYTVKGQRSSTGNGWGKRQYTQVIGNAYDANITRFRPKIICADSDVTSNDAINRAKWEAQIRAGRSINVTVVLPTWTQSNGDLWRENLIVYTSIPKLKVNGELLIREVEYTLDKDKSSIKMNLVDPSIYVEEPKKTVKKKIRRSLWV